MLKNYNLFYYEKKKRKSFHFVNFEELRLNYNLYNSESKMKKFANCGFPVHFVT